MSKTPSIPVVTLYGEAQGWPTPDLVFYEPLIDRSRLHNFKIKPHRHSRLIQIFYLRSGAGIANLDDCEQSLRAPALLVVPEMCVHDFRWDVDVGGHVLTLASPLTEHIAGRMETPLHAVHHAQIYPTGEDLEYLDGLFMAFANEYRSYAAERTTALESLASLLLIWLNRQQHSPVEGVGTNDRASKHLATFQRLVDDQFQRQTSIEQYAEQLGITAAHLNSICRRLTKRSALHLVHERLLLEAKRLLIYTELTISEISYQLGFSEPPYFTRFFKRNTEMSPKQFRSQGGTLDIAN